MALTLVASQTVTADGTSAIAVPALSTVRAAVFLLTASAAATAVGDTLDVYIQTSVDGGTTWDDFVHFTQVLGNGGAKKYLATWQRDIVAESESHAPQDGAIAAGVVQGPVGDLWQLKYKIADGGAHGQSFTFALSAHLIREGR